MELVCYWQGSCTNCSNVALINIDAAVKQTMESADETEGSKIRLIVITK